MANGIRIYHPVTGKVIFDGTSRLAKVLGSFEAGGSGSKKVELSSDKAILWVHAFSTKGAPAGYRADPPKVWVSGHTICWATSGRNPITLTITWGEY